VLCHRACPSGRALRCPPWAACVPVCVPGPSSAAASVIQKESVPERRETRTDRLPEKPRVEFVTGFSAKLSHSPHRATVRPLVMLQREARPRRPGRDGPRAPMTCVLAGRAGPEAMSARAACPPADRLLPSCCRSVCARACADPRRVRRSAPPTVTALGRTRGSPLPAATDRRKARGPPMLLKLWPKKSSRRAVQRMFGVGGWVRPTPAHTAFVPFVWRILCGRVVGGPPPDVSGAHGFLPAAGQGRSAAADCTRRTCGHYVGQPPIAMRCVTSCRTELSLPCWVCEKWERARHGGGRQSNAHFNGLLM